MLQTIYLGTYTRRESKGIYSITLDTEKEQLVDLTLRAEEKSPTYLARSKKERVYTVTEADGPAGCGAYTPALQL